MGTSIAALGQVSLEAVVLIVQSWVLGTKLFISHSSGPALKYSVCKIIVSNLFRVLVPRRSCLTLGN